MATNFANRLKELRQSKDLSQKEFSEMLKISQSAIAKYESGQWEPKLETLEIFADFFKVDMNYITGKTPPEASIDIISPAPADLSPEDQKDKLLLEAYHEAPDHIQRIVDVCLEPYIPDKYL